MPSLVCAIEPTVLISVASLLISLGALGFTVYQALINLRPNRVEEIETNPLSQEGLTKIDWKLVNRGFGPAVITSYEVLVDERPAYIGPLSEIIKAWDKDFGTIPVSFQMARKRPGYILPREASITVLKMALPTPPLKEMTKLSDLDKIDSDLQRFKVEVSYKSLFFYQKFTYKSWVGEDQR
jgi:hypothetical protein